MTTPKVAECLICGERGLTLTGVIRWKTGRPEYTAGPRCADRAACRQRVETAGEEWDVADEQEGAA